jgi:hypothetical protein
MNKPTKLIVAQLFIIAILLGSNLLQLLPKTPLPTNNTYTVPSSPAPYSTVDWELAEAVPLTLSSFAGTTTPYQQVVSFNQPNLQQLRFDLTWTDDRSSFFSGRGFDTLTLILTGADGTFYTASGKSARWTKQGSIQLTVYTLIVLVDSDDHSLFRRFADQGNTFSLQVTSTYYTPTVSHSM